MNGERGDSDVGHCEASTGCFYQSDAKRGGRQWQWSMIYELAQWSYMNTGDHLSSPERQSPPNSKQGRTLCDRCPNTVRVTPGRDPLGPGPGTSVASRARVGPQSLLAAKIRKHPPRPYRPDGLMMMFHLHCRSAVMIDPPRSVRSTLAIGNRLSSMKQHILVANLVTASLAIQAIWLTLLHTRKAAGVLWVIIYRCRQFRSLPWRWHSYSPSSRKNQSPSVG